MFNDDDGGGDGDAIAVIVYNLYDGFFLVKIEELSKSMHIWRSYWEKVDYYPAF